ncbi:hypothetical protein [Actinomadura rudentiformis]|uniref:Serine/threonine protein kinase n=1 Tax=Actinomadura rudentiformis TaxID=359158 RepID=A0A6H9YPC5_9ACTN|nr:hypothetical protein [Actinomadura rudentiformis]KAB2349005.1 hypothetical protein F8566_14770 [Actinomadura rudentiformis]
MSRPLPPGDPAQLGPYRLSARLSETSAGIVFLGEDPEGRRASVAVLTRGAAGDAAARDRFRAAITAALPGPGRPPQYGPDGPAPVVAAQPDGPAPWVATRYDADQPARVGAERFLDSVLLEGAFRGRWGGGRRRGPQFQPYWQGASVPALQRPPEPPPPVVVERTERGLVSAILTLAAVLVVLALLMLVLFACQPTAKSPPPPPPEPTLQTPTPSPSPTTETPSPSPTPTPTPSPRNTDDGGGPV